MVSGLDERSDAGPLGEDDVIGCRLISALRVDVSICGSLNRQTLWFCRRMAFVTRSTWGLAGRACSNLSTPPGNNPNSFLIFQTTLLHCRCNKTLIYKLLFVYIYDYSYVNDLYIYFIPLFLFNLCTFFIFSMHFICCWNYAKFPNVGNI